MKIALLNENSQAAKNSMIEACLRKVVEPMGHEVVNYGMYTADDACQLTYVKCGLLAGILLHSRALIRRAGEGLGKIPNVHGFLSLEASLQAGVLSFTVDGLSPESVAEEMAKRGIALRAGLHCAPFAHKTVGTLPDGTVRLSVSAFNRESEIDTFLSSLRAIAAGQAKN